MRIKQEIGSVFYREWRTYFWAAKISLNQLRQND